MRWPNFKNLEKTRVIDGVMFTIGGGLVLLYAFLLTHPVFATEKPVATPPTVATPANEQQQNQYANQANSQIATAGGGQGGGASVNMGGDRSTAIGLAHTAPAAPVCPNGLVPGRGKHRGHGSPLYSISAVCDAPDEAQSAAIQAARDHELALARFHVERLRAEAEAARADVERLLAVREICAEQVSRGLQACVSK